jgi:type I restriction enzyme S subunit
VLLDENVERIGHAKAEELVRHRIRPGDILFARRGAQAAGLSALAETRHSGWLCGTGAIRLRVEASAIDPVFLSFVLSSERVVQWIRHHAIGATMPNLNEGVIKRIPLRLPPLGIQRALASILLAFDDKIDLNRRMNETLEELARTIFKSWFVDFDPVKAKAEGKQPIGMDADTAALFPSKFVDSELGRIPEGWPLTSLGAFMSLQRGTTYKSQLLDKPGPVLLGLASIQRNGGFRRDRLTTYGGESPDKLLVRSGELFVSLKDVTQAADLLGSVARLPPDICHGRLTQDTVKLDLGGDAPPSVFLYWLLRDSRCRDYFRGRATGTTNLGLAREDFLSFLFARPSKALLTRFSEIAEQLYCKGTANDSESITLAALRDLLLPKLISGELRIPDAEKLAEAVL